MSDLTKLAQPFPKKLISKPAPGSHGDYINHAIINQRLLQILGPFSFSVDREIYDQGQHLTGVVCTLTLTIDSEIYYISEVGEADKEVIKDGAKKGQYVDDSNGARLKKATSDAFKRCAMRAGVGLELWSKNNYFLYDRLMEKNDDQPKEEEVKPEEVEE